MTTNKTVIITSGVTWTVPVDFVSLIAVHGIGGGVCGGPGFLGATDNETFHGFQSTYTDYAGTFAHGYSGDGGWYCKATTATVPLAPGQVLNLHVAAASAVEANAGVWINKYFGGSPPDCLSDDTWIKDNGGNLIVRAPGGDSSSSRVGSVRIEGGFGETTFPQLRTSSGAGGAGGPAGVPDGETQNGAQSGFVNPTQVKFFGSGGGSGNLTESAGLPGIGNRTTVGVGGGSGASKGGDGGNITGNLSVSSSLLLPSITNPYAADAAQGNVTFDFGNRDFTIEFWHQHPLLGAAGFSGTLLSCWDTDSNKGWQITAGEGSPFSVWPLLRYSTDGSDENLVPLELNPVLATAYTDGGTYYGPFQLLGWDHVAICRESGAIRVFVDGYPGLYFLSATDYTFTPGVNFFASTAKLTIGANLASGAINTVIGPDGDQGPFPGWYGNMRITDGVALYTCPATSMSFLGQQFTPPTSPLTGGDFNCDWPGNKGDTISTWTDGAGNPHDVTFLGSAVIDSDQYCYPPPAPEIGGNGNAGSTGNLWTDGNLTVGPGGGGGGGGGDLARYRMLTGGDGGDGGKYGGGGGQGGGVNSGIYVGLGNVSASPGLGGLGEQGLIVIEYVSSESPALTGNITETLSPIDTQSSQLIGGGQTAEALNPIDTQSSQLIGGAQTTESLNPIDTVDATLIPVTRPKWLTIGGDSSDSIFPN